MKKLAEIKKNSLSCKDYFTAAADDKNDIAVLTRADGHTRKLGIFSLSGKSAFATVDVPDGTYTNLIDKQPLTVTGGKLTSTGEPIIFTV